MGDALFVDGFDLSGDVGSLSQISGPMGTEDFTPISASAIARLGLLHDGLLDFIAFWNHTNLVTTGILDSEHDVLKGRPETDRTVSYYRSTVLGAPACSMISKQITYDGTRNQDGSLTFGVNTVANGFGLEWGNNLTAGKRTEAAAGNGLSVDLGAVPISYSFGWAVYLHVFAFTGTSVTVKVQDSADNATWADVTGAVFTAATGRTAQRITGASTTATVRRYLRVVSTGTYSNAVYAVNFIRYEAVGAPR